MSAAGRMAAGESEPVQYWLSDLFSGMPLTTLVRLAKLLGLSLRGQRGGGEQ